MSKVNKKKNYNSISHNNGSNHSIEPSFAFDERTKDLFESIYKTINKLSVPTNHTYTKETLITLELTTISFNDLIAFLIISV
jgi:hypothetical protein